EFSVIGVTSTPFSVKQLMMGQPNLPQIDYHSFFPDDSYNMDVFLAMMSASGYDASRIAVLSEDDTAYGNVVATNPQRKKDASNGQNQPEKYDPDGKILYVSFPREISLLRNAPVDSPSGTMSGSVPSPYLHFSVKDSNA